MSIWKELKTPILILAPMDDVTDVVFRTVIARCAPPDLYFTEFVNVDALQSPGREAALHKLRISTQDKPIIGQLWGKTPANYKKCAADLVEMGFDGIDLNMGCPEKAIVKNGCCAALINNRPLAADIITATKEGVAGRIPVSVKTRLGFNENDFSWHEFLLRQDLAALIVHGRTRKEMSKVPARWEDIARVRELRDQLAPHTLIIGNGDVDSRQQAEELAKRHKLDGVMIGRGALHDPFVFSADSPWVRMSPAEKIELYRQHIELFTQTWQAGERNAESLKKFCKLYINGFDGASDLRVKLMQCRTAQELLTVLSSFSAV